MGQVTCVKLGQLAWEHQTMTPDKREQLYITPVEVVSHHCRPRYGDSRWPGLRSGRICMWIPHLFCVLIGVCCRCRQYFAYVPTLWSTRRPQKFGSIELSLIRPNCDIGVSAEFTRRVGRCVR